MIRIDPTALAAKWETIIALGGTQAAQVSQEVPTGIPLDTGLGLNIANILDYGTTVVGLMFLIYLMKGLVSGDLISRSALDSIVEKSVRETLKEMK